MKLSICLGVCTLALVRALDWGMTPQHVTAIVPPGVPTYDHTPDWEQAPKVGTWDATIHMPPLDVTAKRTNKQSGKVTRHFVCGPMFNMTGTWDGLPNLDYGRVSRCEWM